jgi:hypothetical protein
MGARVRSLGICAIGVALLAAAGCGLGPCVINENRLRYNEAVRQTWNEQFLLNLVRLRYLDPIQFDVVSNILSSYQFSASVNESNQLHSAFVPAGVYNPNLYTQITGSAQAGVQESPAITISPLEGADFTKSVLGPIHLESIVALTSTGWDMDLALRMMVHEINGIENIRRVIGELSGAPQYEQFTALARLMQELHRRGLLEFAYEDIEKPLSEPTAVADVRPGDLTSAAQKKYKIHQERVDGKEIVTLWGKEHLPVMRVAPGVWTQPAGAEVLRILQLAPDRPSYKLVLGATTGQLKGPSEPGGEVIVSTRSVEGMMLFASKGVEVPPDHIAEGLVRDVVDEAGQPFDWSRVMGDLIRVHSQKMKPKHAFVATKYRGYWFYIDDDDLNSKRTFALVMTVFAQEVAGGILPGPVISVPVGAGLTATPGAVGGGGGGGRRGSAGSGGGTGSGAG